MLNCLLPDYTRIFHFIHWPCQETDNKNSFENVDSVVKFWTPRQIVVYRLNTVALHLCLEIKEVWLWAHNVSVCLPIWTHNHIDWLYEMWYWTFCHCKTLQCSTSHCSIISEENTADVWIPLPCAKFEVLTMMLLKIHSYGKLCCVDS
jgi:hypothetical protein